MSMSCEDLAQQPFTRGIISRKVNSLIRSGYYRESDRDWLKQEMMIRVIDSWSSYDESVAHFKSFVTTVVERHTATLVRRRSTDQHRSTISLSTLVKSDDGQLTQLAQMVGEEGIDRRLGRATRLSATELASLAIDLQSEIAKLPPDLKMLLERRKTQSMGEIAQDTNIPRSTLNDWMCQIRDRFLKAGLKK